MTPDRFYGLYRGRVDNNIDPSGLGRLQVSVPNVPGTSQLSWAKPCAALAGSDNGLFVIPAVDTLVWIQFEAGNPADPVWMGCFWDDTSRPPANPAMEMMKVLKTAGITITLTDTQGAANFELEMTTGAKITLGPTGITLDNGMGATIAMEGPRVTINGGALEVL